MFYVSSYALSVDRRRTRIAKLLEGFEQRVQYSVFECDLEDVQLRELQRKLRRRLNTEEGDSVRIYRICASCVQRIEIIGTGPPPERRPEVIII